MVVQTVSRYTGRGPTKARTHFAGDVVVVVLEDTLTRSERILIADGRRELVLDARRAFQSTMRDELVKVIEDVVERPVAAFLSDHHLDPDVAVEVFLLADGAPDTGIAVDGAG